jgi:cephalosporin hydroxylase
MIRNIINSLLGSKNDHTPLSQAPTDILDTTVSIGLQGIYEGHYNVTYKGVKCIKCPMDYVLYQMIIEEVKPDLIIEIGSYLGGSTLYLADLLELQGKGEVHTIDIDYEIDQKAKDHKRIKFFRDGWENYDLKVIKDFKTVLVIEDGTHRYKDSLNAMNKFWEAVSLNSYLIVEDGIVDALGMSKEHKGGPVRAIKEFIAGNNNFQVANQWSDFFGKNATFNTIGFLKRIS